MQQALEEQNFQSDVQRRQTLGAAAMEEFGGKIASAGASAQLSAGRAEADFQRIAASLEGAKGLAQLSQGRREARIGLMTGEANASGQRLAAVGTLFSGLGSMGSQWNSWRYNGGGTGTGYVYKGGNLAGGKSIGTTPYLS
jgi:hypothetical protein